MAQQSNDWVNEGISGYHAWKETKEQLKLDESLMAQKIQKGKEMQMTKNT